MSETTLLKLAKEITNGRIAKFYKEHGQDLAPTTKGHMLEAATNELKDLLIDARIDEAEKGKELVFDSRNLQDFTERIEHLQSQRSKESV